MMTGAEVEAAAESGRVGEGRAVLLQVGEGVVQAGATARMKMAEAVLVRLVEAGVQMAISRKVCGSPEGVVASCRLGVVVL